MRSTTAFTFALLLIAASGRAATLYVATTGSDSNNGSSSAPFRTITAASSKAQPGDVVSVGAGVYNGVAKINAKGTAAAQIAFRANGAAIIDGNGTAAGTDLVQITSAQYVEFSGFEVRNSTRIGICSYNSANVTIRNNRAHDNVKGGIYVGASSFGGSHDAVVDGNEVFHNVLENQNHLSGGGWSQSLGIQNTDRARVTGNKVYENDGEGIVFVLSDNGVAQRNEIFDNFSVELYLDNAQFTTLDGNFVYSTGKSRYFRNSFPAAGISIANEQYGTNNPSTDNRIINNIVVNNRWGFYYGNYEVGGGLKNTTIANNTFYGASQDILKIDASSHANSLVENNIFFQTTGQGATVAGGGITYARNNWYGANAGSASSVNDIVGNPRLVNAGGLKAADYKLLSGSPIAASGLAIAAVTTDYFGTPRSTTIDLGAHQLTLSSTNGAGPVPTMPVTPATSGRRRVGTH
jgi:parallel beta-helix repeat protein